MKNIVAAFTEAVKMNEDFIKENANWATAYAWRNMDWAERWAFRCTYFFAAIGWR